MAPPESIDPAEDGQAQPRGEKRTRSKRNSLLDQRLPPEQKASFDVTLKIRFPEDGENRNQALIIEYLSDGWVLPEEAQ